jgi:predicted MFS family arabinose efflux permease
VLAAAGGADADVATGMQTTIFNLGIAAGSLAGGVVLGREGAWALPWVALVLAGTGLSLTIRRRVETGGDDRVHPAQTRGQAAG